MRPDPRQEIPEGPQRSSLTPVSRPEAIDMLASHARKTAERLTTALVRRANAYADATFVIPTVRRASPATELERVARDVQPPNACRHLEGFASFGLARPDDPRVLSTPHPRRYLRVAPMASRLVSAHHPSSVPRARRSRLPAAELRALRRGRVTPSVRRCWRRRVGRGRRRREFGTRDRCSHARDDVGRGKCADGGAPRGAGAGGSGGV